MPYFSSSAIRAAEYNPASLTLAITFTSGRTYDYYGVPQYVYNGLLAAGSKGEYFNDNIRDQYGYR